jgi:glutathione peroxidase
MKPLLISLLLAAAASAAGVYDYTLKTIDGTPESLATFKGKTVLIVNVASKCGYTPQYAGLQKLYTKYKDRGFVILGFPANNFGLQEPGTNEEIKTFCSRTYNVTFPMFSKVSVKGDDKTPLYQFLTEQSPNTATHGDIKWNFTKFLIGKDGKVLERFESAVTPESPEMEKAVEASLQ